MAAIAALSGYGSNDSEESDDASHDIDESMYLHLKPLNAGNTVATLQSQMQLAAAPVVATKV